MGLLEKASQAAKKQNSSNTHDTGNKTDTVAAGLYKRSLAYTAGDHQPEDKKKSLTSKPAAVFSDFSDMPPLVRPFLCFEQFTAAYNCRRCLVAGFAPEPADGEERRARILLCKGFDFTTENRFMLPYRVLSSLTADQPAVCISGAKELEIVKGYVSSTEFRALRQLFVAKLAAAGVWFIAAKSALDTNAPDFSLAEQNLPDFAERLAAAGLPSSLFIPAAVTAHCGQRTELLIKTALTQKKQCMLLHLSVENLLASCMHSLPEQYNRAVFLEIASYIKKAAGSDNILNCIAPDNIRAGIFTAQMTDPDLYLFQLNKSLANNTGTDVAVSLVSCKISADNAEISAFFS